MKPARLWVGGVGGGRIQGGMGEELKSRGGLKVG